MSSGILVFFFLFLKGQWSSTHIYRKEVQMIKKQHLVVFRILRGYQRQLHRQTLCPALWSQITCWPAHFSLEANSRTSTGAPSAGGLLPSCPNLSPHCGTPRMGPLPSDMLDSWNMVSKAWWISAKEGRSEGFHCQPGQTRPESDHPEALLTSMQLAILKEKSRNERSIPFLLPIFGCDKLK